MARQGYYTEAWEKKFEVFKNFSRGLNTMTSQDNMSDSELSKAVNVSLDERGSITRRTGMLAHKSTVLPSGLAQGYFRHYLNAAQYVELIARGGKIEVDGVVQAIADFQATRPIEAVQYYDKTYIATGSRVLVFDGTTVSDLVPYAPQPLEALYIGTNALAANPDDYLSDGVGSTLQLAGVTFSSRYGVMNEPFTVTAYHIAQAGSVIEYQFEYRYPFMEEGAYYLGQDWSTDKSWTFIAEGEGDMQFRINARVQGDVVASAQYLVPAYRIKPAPDAKDIAPQVGGIQTCNRILLHWDRLVLYGDTENINTMYMSHLKNPNYFPVPNNLQFETTNQEPITAAIRFRDYMLVFTLTSTQALFGKAPTDYRRTVLNTAQGCVAPKSVVVMDNYVTFLSSEGVHFLKSVGYVDDKANIARLDTNISNLITPDEDACAIIADDQYHLVYPSKNKRFRYSKTLQSWVTDESPSLDLNGLYLHGHTLYAQRKSGDIIQFSDDVYSDLGVVYPAIFETRYFDFNQPYHAKKLKELQLTASAPNDGQVAEVRVFMDGANYNANYMDWVANLAITEDYTTFIDKLKISGKCMRTKVQITHTQDEYLQFLGLSFVFKAKKP